MNQLILAAIIGVLGGSLSGYYWSTRGYKGWHLYFSGMIAFFGISVLIIKAIS